MEELILIIYNLILCLILICVSAYFIGKYKHSGDSFLILMLVLALTTFVSAGVVLILAVIPDTIKYFV